ncbi:MAG: TIGR00153 family protein [Xanthomonadales bacterium]|jgi:predicted phosphate transport protein (TIGR00153 family)|nr:TIGR00153 family protein [Xanthomonadales bacterium]
MVGGYLSGIFASSPIGPLQKHMTRVVECVGQLTPFMEAVLDGDAERRHAIAMEIVRLEHKADDLKKELRLHLPTSLFMPIDRRDMLEILAMQDEVAGVTRDLTGMMDARSMVIPEAMGPGFLELARTCVQACEQAHTAISELDELIETGFDNSERTRISGMLNELDALEHWTDEQAAALAGTLMALEDDIPPVQVMFLYRAIDLTSNVADCAQRVGSRLQLTLAR